MKKSVKDFCQLNGLDEHNQNLADILYTAYIESGADEERRNQEKPNDPGRKE